MDEQKDDPLVEVEKRMNKAYDEVRSAAIQYAHGRITDDEFRVHLDEHYSAQRSMNRLLTDLAIQELIYKGVISG